MPIVSKTGTVTKDKTVERTIVFAAKLLSLSKSCVIILTAVAVGTTAQIKVTSITFCGMGKILKSKRRIQGAAISLKNASL